ncbi:hypothetical protein CRE_09642 [Caenorhabditis remanei]|uniref:Uncharacterized protein n=1 Tax=Caenorhabditis remanei TaxID=31234 RepID=E3MWZ7_CAERE|nr:hypothetical protein CRE_09642 [Caenorhabditis remanei]
MPNPTTASPVTRTLHIGEDVEITLYSFVYYPMWFWVVIAVGFTFCTISCAVWFFCAMARLRKEKPCNHPVYEARTIITKDGEEKPADKTQKSEKHCKKVGALSEAESLAKSFKSVRSKKSTKSSRKSAKSTKSSHKSGKSMKKKTSKEENVDEPRNADENQEDHGGQKGDAKSGKSRKSSRTDGGRDGEMFVVDMDQHEIQRENNGENVLKKLASSFLIWRK